MSSEMKFTRIHIRYIHPDVLVHSLESMQNSREPTSIFNPHQISTITLVGEFYFKLLLM